ncbi:MAG: hypothetical protein ACRCR6_02280 [Plesiomonas sp.]
MQVMNVSPTHQAVSVLPTSVNPPTEQAGHDNQVRERIPQTAPTEAAPHQRAIDSHDGQGELLPYDPEAQDEDASAAEPTPVLLESEGEALIEGQWESKEECPLFYPPFPNALTAVNHRMALHGKVIVCRYWYSVHPRPKASFRTKT